MSHSLNEMIKRTKPNNPSGVFWSHLFVSCTCGWFVWADHQQSGEDQWIDHMTTEVLRDADGDIVSIRTR